MATRETGGKVSDSSNIISKLQIINEMATESSVKNLTNVVIEYVKMNEKKTIGFQQDIKEIKSED